MSEFKLKSIDEFDSLFLADINGENENAVTTRVEPDSEPVQPKESLIPEISVSEEPVKEAEAAESGKDENVFSVAPVAIGNALYTSERMSNADPGEIHTEKEDEPERKKSKGALAGKIVAIVLLVATVVVFLLGCFVSVFLDNNGSSLGGYTFNTLAKDVDELGISKGDLILAQKIDDYEMNDVVGFPSSTGSGCDLYVVQTAMPYGEDISLTVSDLTDSTTVNQPASSCYGAVMFYIPFLGSLIGFAMNNAILVCVLFVLLAALWCLVLILIERSESKKSRKVEEESEEE